MGDRRLTVERLWVGLGWTLLVLSLVGWPVSALTFAADEPQAVLGLSWAALAFSSAGVLVSGQTMKRLMRRLDELGE